MAGINIKKYMHQKINTIDDASLFLKELESGTRFFGGRKVTKCGMKGSLSLNNIVHHIHAIVSKTELDPNSAKKAQELLTLIDDLDKDLKGKLRDRNILTKLLTKISRIGNLFFDRKEKIQEIQGFINLSKSALLKTQDKNVPKIEVVQSQETSENIPKPDIKKREKEIAAPVKHEAVKTQDKRSEIELVSISTDKKGVEPIFRELLQKVEKVVTTKDPKMQGDSAFNNFKRFVFMGCDEAGQSLVFVKIPSGKYIKIQRNALKNEQLAFLVSHHLGLGVVPTTKVINTELLTIEVVFRHTDCIVQEAVSVASDQIHLEGVMPDDFLQKVELTHAHKAILFNLILGRHDGRACNSVLDKQNRFIEVDNEYIGLETTDSWLLNEFKHTALSPDLIEYVIALDDSIIPKIFQELQSQDSFAFEDSVKTNILSNFRKIKQFLATNRHHQILISDLMEINKSTPRKPSP